jgi:hypothetical protein
MIDLDKLLSPHAAAERAHARDRQTALVLNVDPVAFALGAKLARKDAGQRVLACQSVAEMFALLVELGVWDDVDGGD